MIHDVPHDPVSDEVVNVDFYQVNLAKKMRVKVPLEYAGISQAVKDGGVERLRPLEEMDDGLMIAAVYADVRGWGSMFGQQQTGHCLKLHPGLISIRRQADGGRGCQDRRPDVAEG